MKKCLVLITLLFIWIAAVLVAVAQADMIAGTSRPGEPGNVAIAGHRDSFFRSRRHIREGDQIVLETTAECYRYFVNSTEITNPTAVSVLQSHEQNELTLVTCYPFSYLGRAPERFIVHALLADAKNDRDRGELGKLRTGEAR